MKYVTSGCRHQFYSGIILGFILCLIVVLLLAIGVYWYVLNHYLVPNS